MVIQELTDELLRVQGLLQRWQGYSRLFGAISRRLKRREEETEELLSAPACQDGTVELIQARVQAINVSAQYRILACSYELLQEIHLFRGAQSPPMHVLL